MKELDLRVQKTYKTLINALEELLHEKDFEAISVKELCDVAMIGRPTFYKHFLDKYDFLTFYIKQEMTIIFEHALENLNEKEDNFFILVFEQLLDQFDNLSFLIFSLQMNSDVIIELESVQEYGKNMLKKQLSKNGVTSSIGDLAVVNEYKAQMIMAVTIQSVYWYKNNKDKVSRNQIVELYKQTLAKLQ